MKLTFSWFCWAHLSEALLGSILGSHLAIILRARVVIGAIVGARGAPEHLKAGVSYERLFQEGPKEFRLGVDWGGTLNFGLLGAQLPPPGPSPSTEKERKRVDVYTRRYTLERATLTRRLPPTGVGGLLPPQIQAASQIHQQQMPWSGR